MRRVAALAAFLALAAAAAAESTAAEWSAYKVASAGSNEPTLLYGYLPAGLLRAVRRPRGSALKQVMELNLEEERLPVYGESFTNLTVDIQPETESRLHIKIKPRGVKRWEVPESIVQRPMPKAGLDEGELLYLVPKPKTNTPFGLTVHRKGAEQPIFDTAGHTFLFKDQYIELTTTVPRDASLYGLGETTLNTGLLLPRDGTIITLWNRDKSSNYANVNLYGSHPFYLQVNADGSSHGVLFLNSNGMDVQLKETSLTFRAIGGLVDLYFFMGPAPEEVIRQYHEVIGRSVMPPYWALGLHQSKWGYQNISVVEEVVANYSAAGLPLESLWLDIELMQSRFRTMTFDEHRFPVQAMRRFVQKLHAAGQSWVPILDPAVSVDSKYRAYLEGSQEGVWMRDHRGQTYVGQVWPGASVYPDYLASPRIGRWLNRQLAIFYQEVPFDGLWLDMCEPSNFCTGMNCRPDPRNATAKYWLELDTPTDYSITKNMLVKNRTTCQMVCEVAPVTNTLAYPPYAIKNDGQKLSQSVIHPTATHADGSTQYDAHNLYGTAMAMRHYEATVAITGRRPFILTRSTFPGAGKFTAHWTGDNAANWENLFYSIAGIINTNMWGMSMAGADICGYIDMLQQNTADPANLTLPDADFQHLCLRWTSAGAFYPFSRNHMIIYSRPHEFYRWPDVAAAAKKAYGLRYQLLTYMYGSLHVASTKGGTLARPLLFTDPSDRQAHNATQQWMLGEAVLVSPVITPNTTLIKPHFTAGNWYSAWDFTKMAVSTGRAVPLEVPYGDVPVHIRGGAVVPMQRGASEAKVTRDVRHSPVTLVVTLPGHVSPRSGSSRGAGSLLPPYALDEHCAEAHRREAGKLVSCGLLYMDEDTLYTGANNTLQVWYASAVDVDGRAGELTNVVVSAAGDAASKMRVDSVVVLGVPGDEGDVAFALLNRAATPPAMYDASKQLLRIEGLDLQAGEPIDLHWRVRSA